MNSSVISLLAASAVVLIAPVFGASSPDLTAILNLYRDVTFISNRNIYSNNNTKNVRLKNNKQDIIAKQLREYYFEQRVTRYTCIAETNIAALISESDDFCANRFLLIQATQQLLDQNRCTRQDFAMNRGWIRAPDRGIFHFSIYCNDFNEIVYLDATRGTLTELPL